MIFEQIPVGILQNFSYLIGDDGEGAVVDPAWQQKKVLEAAERHGLKIKAILLTHTHYDHITGIRKIAKAADAAVYVHKEEADEVKDKVDRIKTVDEGTEIKVGKIKIRVFHTPGQRPGSVCYLAGNKLITGDTLFIEGCGRVDLAGSDIKKMFESLQRLKKLDENIEVYPGHDYGSAKSSTIKQEKENNPYMRCNSFEEFSTIR